jgi:hypothetical protein
LARLALSWLGLVVANITVPGEHGWCRAESRGTGWAGLVEVWTGRCPIKSVGRLIFRKQIQNTKYYQTQLKLEVFQNILQ